MHSEAGQPTGPCSETVGGAAEGVRSFKNVRLLKRSFADTAAAAPKFASEVMTEGSDSEWFKEGITIESDDEMENGGEHEGIPTVQIPKHIREELV